MAGLSVPGPRTEALGLGHALRLTVSVRTGLMPRLRRLGFADWIGPVPGAGSVWFLNWTGPPGTVPGLPPRLALLTCLDWPNGPDQGTVLGPPIPAGVHELDQPSSGSDRAGIGPSAGPGFGAPALASELRFQHQRWLRLRESDMSAGPGNGLRPTREFQHGSQPHCWSSNDAGQHGFPHPDDRFQQRRWRGTRPGQWQQAQPPVPATRPNRRRSRFSPISGNDAGPGITRRRPSKTSTPAPPDVARRKRRRRPRQRASARATGIRADQARDSGPSTGSSNGPGIPPSIDAGPPPVAHRRSRPQSPARERSPISARQPCPTHRDGTGLQKMHPRPALTPDRIRYHPLRSSEPIPITPSSPIRPTGRSHQFR